MGIEPTRAFLPSLQNKRFGAIVDAKCDRRVNFRGMWGHARLRRDTSMHEVLGSSLSVVGLRPGQDRSVNDATWLPLTGRPQPAVNKHR
jgi:hypothetical protein